MEETYTKSLCMKRLTIRKCRFDSSHFFDPGGKVNPAFGYIVKGCASLRSVATRLELGEGSLFYIPEGVKCSSIWRGSPEIEFYMISIVNNYPEPSAGSYALQRIDALSTPETGERFERIFALLASDERVGKVRAIGLYYDFYADVLPLLVPSPPVKYNQAMLAACLHRGALRRGLRSRRARRAQPYQLVPSLAPVQPRSRDRAGEAPLPRPDRKSCRAAALDRLERLDHRRVLRLQLADILFRELPSRHRAHSRRVPRNDPEKPG